MISTLTATEHLTTNVNALAEEPVNRQKYERLADLKLRNSDTIVISKHGCTLKVRNGALSVEYREAGKEDTHKLLKINKGTHKIKQIVLTSKGGCITMDAIEWCKQQNITVYLISYDGEVLQVLTPKQPRNAKLAYLQYQASKSKIAISIGVELIREKTLSQIETVEKYARLYGQFDAIMALKKGLLELHRVHTIESLRHLEGMLAMSYFNAFTSVPIKWERQAMKAIPEHWSKISPRNSLLSGDGSGRHATNPYHAALNFAYALLEAQVMQSIAISCLEPTVGFLHAYQEGRNSLAFDLMEPFRAVVDSMVLEMFQKTKFSKGDFIQTETGEVRMSDELRRYLLASCRVKDAEIDKVSRWLRSTIEE